MLNEKVQEIIDIVTEEKICSDLHEAFTRIGLDTKKYTLEYLVEEVTIGSVDQKLKDLEELKRYEEYMEEKERKKREGKEAARVLSQIGGVQNLPDAYQNARDLYNATGDKIKDLYNRESKIKELEYKISQTPFFLKPFKNYKKSIEKIGDLEQIRRERQKAIIDNRNAEKRKEKIVRLSDIIGFRKGAGGSVKDKKEEPKYYEDNYKHMYDSSRDPSLSTSAHLIRKLGPNYEDFKDKNDNPEDWFTDWTGKYDPEDHLNTVKDYNDTRKSLLNAAREEIEKRRKQKPMPLPESYTLSELNEAFNALGLDTEKYTTEYLAEQLGFEPLK
jgi:hypothetical protein